MRIGPANRFASVEIMPSGTIDLLKMIDTMNPNSPVLLDCVYQCENTGRRPLSPVVVNSQSRFCPRQCVYTNHLGPWIPAKTFDRNHVITAFEADPKRHAIGNGPSWCTDQDSR